MGWGWRVGKRCSPWQTVLYAVQSTKQTDFKGGGGVQIRLLMCVLGYL